MCPYILLVSYIISLEKENHVNGFPIYFQVLMERNNNMT